MVDDTLGVSKCGVQSMEKNSLITSFVEAHKLPMHEGKSVVVHVGNVRKCENPCPNLKRHKNKMPETKSTTYLGHIFSQNGGIKKTIKDRQNKAWGKVSQILGILGEVDYGQKVIEVGLLLRDPILTSGLLYSAEAWSAVSETDIKCI